MEIKCTPQEFKELMHHTIPVAGTIDNVIINGKK